jgi:hypothetical protein
LGIGRFAQKDAYSPRFRVPHRLLPGHPILSCGLGPPGMLKGRGGGRGRVAVGGLGLRGKVPIGLVGWGVAEARSARGARVSGRGAVWG